MVEVFAAKGPLAGRRLEIAEDKVEAATGKGGWAVKLEPGVQLLADPGAPYDPSWEIPGYTRRDLEPFAEKGPKPVTADIKEGAAKTADAKTSSAGSVSAKQPAPAPAKEPAEEPTSDDKTKPSSK